MKEEPHSLEAHRSQIAVSQNRQLSWRLLAPNHSDTLCLRAMKSGKGNQRQAAEGGELLHETFIYFYTS